jgi:hypothetical protein
MSTARQPTFLTHGRSVTATRADGFVPGTSGEMACHGSVPGPEAGPVNGSSLEITRSPVRTATSPPPMKAASAGGFGY